MPMEATLDLKRWSTIWTSTTLAFLTFFLNICLSWYLPLTFIFPELGLPLRPMTFAKNGLMFFAQVLIFAANWVTYVPPASLQSRSFSLSVADSVPPGQYTIVIAHLGAGWVSNHPARFRPSCSQPTCARFFRRLAPLRYRHPSSSGPLRKEIPNTIDFIVPSSSSFALFLDSHAPDR